MKSVVLDEKSLCDLECLLGGYFYPLRTFMNKKEWEKVCNSLCLPNGKFFPLPINLAVGKDSVELGETIRLTDETNYPLAELEITDLYQPDINWECKNAYGTEDTNHPYVQYKQKHKNSFYVSGNLTKLNDIRHYDFKQYRLLPKQVKDSFSKDVLLVGFQTRNPMHRAHYELTKYALEETKNKDAKLLLNPVVGETQTTDIDYYIRVHCYKGILEYYKKNQVILALLPLSMRMAGPREACLHALIRKNYGCTHFIVGRDHAGPSYKTQNGENFYEPYEAQEILQKYSKEIGITPIISKAIVFNNSKKIYQPIDQIKNQDEVLQISGTELREKLTKGLDIPEWFSYPNVLSLLKKSIKKRGICFYFVGLSGSGKTTFANKLKTQILEKYPAIEITILDGDIVRKSLTEGLGFSKIDRSKNVRRIGYVASEIVKHGGVVICANIAPYDEDRLKNRTLIENIGGRYIEIFVDTSLEVCEKRDVKGLYKLAREGKISQFTGISDVFETPTKNEITIQDEKYDFSDLIKSSFPQILMG